jgi:RNA polymerase sigma factor (sigma-70 family)
LQTWLFRIAANKSKDFRERKNAIKRGSGTPSVSFNALNGKNGQPLDPPDSVPGPDQILLNKENLDLLYQAMAQLGSPCQELLELRYFGTLEYSEIAQELDLHPKTVSSRLSRCLDRFKELARPIFVGGNHKSFPSNPYAV